MNSPLDPVLIDGVRTPFMRSYKNYLDLTSFDLGRRALEGLLQKTRIDPLLVNHVTMGRVIPDPNTSNVARECVLASGFHQDTPAHTVTLACISSNMAATQLADMIRNGSISVGVASGVDTCSDPPIRLSRGLRKLLLQLQKVKGPMDILKEWKVLKEFRPKDLIPDVPRVAEFSNGKTMGEGAEILIKQAGVTRQECDEFAVRGHRMAIKALEEGHFQNYIIPVTTPSGETFTQDDGPRKDASVEKLKDLKPAFDRTSGVCTAGNSSFLTDGAGAILLMSREKAESLSLKPMATLHDYLYRAGSPLEEMLSGPALTVPLLLQKNGLSVKDIDVWEIHEAFAGQVLANLKLMNRASWMKERLNLAQPLPEIPMEKINSWGGSLSFGHPFGATGTRLIYTAAKRLEVQGGTWAVVTGCAAGGHGSAILIKRES